MPSSHLILCHPLLLLPPIPPSIRVFSNESALCVRWPKYWSFSFSISPSNEHPGLIFRMDWLDLLAVQGTFKRLLQHHISKASIFRHSAFFTVQLSHPYMTTGETIALTRWTFVGKVMSLLFNMLSRCFTWGQIRRVPQLPSSSRTATKVTAAMHRSTLPRVHFCFTFSLTGIVPKWGGTGLNLCARTFVPGAAVRLLREICTALSSLLELFL